MPGEDAYYVLGEEHLGTTVARRLRDDGHSVCLVDEATERQQASGTQIDQLDIQMLEDAGMASASTAVVATRSDSQNLLLAQLVRANFDVPDIVVLANVPHRLEAFEHAGHVPVCVTSTLADAVVDSI